MRIKLQLPSTLGKYILTNKEPMEEKNKTWFALCWFHDFYTFFTEWYDFCVSAVLLQKVCAQTYSLSCLMRTVSQQHLCVFVSKGLNFGYRIEKCINCEFWHGKLWKAWHISPSYGKIIWRPFIEIESGLYEHASVKIWESLLPSLKFSSLHRQYPR